MLSKESNNRIMSILCMQWNYCVVNRVFSLKTCVTVKVDRREEKIGICKSYLK